jgi:hypothetical protein
MVAILISKKRSHLYGKVRTRAIAEEVVVKIMNETKITRNRIIDNMETPVQKLLTHYPFPMLHQIIRTLKANFKLFWSFAGINSPNFNI